MKLLISLLFQDPNCHRCGVGQMHALVPCTYPECQGCIYTLLSKCLASAYGPVQRVKLRGNTWLRGYLILRKY